MSLGSKTLGLNSEGIVEILKVALQTGVFNISVHVDGGTSDPIKSAQSGSDDPNQLEQKFDIEPDL